MLAAYLQGLLKPSPEYGTRSEFAEDVILEGMTALTLADGFSLAITTAASKLAILTHDGKTDTLRRIQAQTVRCSELRMMDIYKIGQEVSNKNGMSLYQLYQLANKNGILDALREHRATSETDSET